LSHRKKYDELQHNLDLVRMELHYKNEQCVGLSNTITKNESKNVKNIDELDSLRKELSSHETENEESIRTQIDDAVRIYKEKLEKYDNMFTDIKEERDTYEAKILILEREKEELNEQKSISDNQKQKYFEMKMAAKEVEIRSLMREQEFGFNNNRQVSSKNSRQQQQQQQQQSSSSQMSSNVYANNNGQQQNRGGTYSSLRSLDTRPMLDGMTFDVGKGNNNNNGRGSGGFYGSNSNHDPLLDRLQDIENYADRLLGDNSFDKDLSWQQNI